MPADVSAPAILALLHAGRPLAPHDAWGAWTLDPAILAAVLVPAWLYWRGVRALWRASAPGRGVRRWEARAFAWGIGVLLVALLSPLHAMGEVLVSAHMVQHTLLMLVAAPLLVAGRPIVAMAWGVPPAFRRAWRRVAHLPGVRAGARALSSWSGGMIAHAVAIWLWHTPALYSATRTDDVVHAAQHASFLLTALLFWWVPVKAVRRRADVGGAVFSLFITTLHTGVLSALLLFGSTTWYAGYDAGVASWGLTPLEDQQLAGIIMWATGGLVYPVFALVLLVDLLRGNARADAGGRAQPPGGRSALRSRAARVVPVLLASLALPLATGCGVPDDGSEHAVRILTGGGDAERGRRAMRRYGCGTCHTIPGVRGANALVGPPLAGVTNRAYLGGVVPNSPDSLVQWIMSPPTMAPRTAMPELGVREADARDMAAYLYRLR